MNDWAWEVPPPPAAPEVTKAIGILRVHPAQTFHVCVLGPWIGLWTHWLDGESRPCKGGACRLCPDTPKRWKGYAAGCVYRRDLMAGTGSWERTVIEITDGCRGILDRDITGAVIKLSRRPGKANNPLIAEVIMPSSPLPQMPPAFDVRPVVARIYGWKQEPAQLADEPPNTLPFAPKTKAV